MPPKKRPGAAMDGPDGQRKKSTDPLSHVSVWAGMYNVDAATVTTLVNVFDKPMAGKMVLFPSMPHYIDGFGCDGASELVPNHPFDQKQYNVSVYDGNLVTVQRAKITLFPGCALLDGQYYHFFLPVAMSGTRNTLILPPLDGADKLVYVADTVTLAAYEDLASLYMTHMMHSSKAEKTGRIAKLIENGLDLMHDRVYDSTNIATFDWKHDTKLELTMFAMSMYASGDAVDAHIAFFESLTGTTFMEKAVVDGYVALADVLQMHPHHPFLRQIMYRRPVAVPPVLTTPTTIAAPQENPLLKQVDDLTQQLEHLKTTQREFKQVTLQEVCKERPDVSHYINFSLGNMSMDNSEECEGWVIRKDALEALCTTTKEYLQCHESLSFGDKLVTLELTKEVRAQVDKRNLELVKTWDLETLRQKFLALQVEYANDQVHYGMVEHMYQFALRIHEERNSYLWKTVQENATLTDATISKSWQAMLKVFSLMQEQIEDETEGKESPWSLGGCMTHFLNGVSKLALMTPDISIDLLAEQIMLGSGKSLIHLNVLDLQLESKARASFSSPLKSLFFTLDCINMDAVSEMTTIKDELKGVTLLDQALLLTAGKPFLKPSLHDSDDTRLYLKHRLRLKPKLLKELYLEKNYALRWAPAPGDDGYDECLARLVEHNAHIKL